ncbi:segregation and condensation protein A [Clostridia bacterium]|nr:segregation and condensation protein A [Clostridia bacterium]
MNLNVKLQAFEGPLDLLLHLLDKNKVSIYDIPIVEITAQYLEYIEAMQRQDLNVMSEFLLMAATLLDIKSRMLLPAPETDEEEEGDPRAELIQQLLEYKMYKCISEELKGRMADSGYAFFKNASLPKEVTEYEQPVDVSELLSNVSLANLKKIFESILRKQEDKIDPIRSKFGKIEKEEISLEEKMLYVEEFAATQKRFSFRKLLAKQESRIELIVTFLTILELMKTGKISISQENVFDDILIESHMVEEEESNDREE